LQFRFSVLQFVKTTDETSETTVHTP